MSKDQIEINKEKARKRQKERFDRIKAEEYRLAEIELKLRKSDKFREDLSKFDVDAVKINYKYKDFEEWYNSKEFRVNIRETFNAARAVK